MNDDQILKTAIARETNVPMPTINTSLYYATKECMQEARKDTAKEIFAKLRESGQIYEDEPDEDDGESGTIKVIEIEYRDFEILEKRYSDAK